jgi:hypothetical protein
LERHATNAQEGDHTVLFSAHRLTVLTYFGLKASYALRSNLSKEDQRLAWLTCNQLLQHVCRSVKSAECFDAYILIDIEADRIY